jgi:biotin synthase
MEKQEILTWLRTTDENDLSKLWQMADRVRQQHVGQDVHLRGLIEISNICARMCGYCGINVNNTAIGRYRMTEDEIIACAHKAAGYGYGTVVMQAGEDYGITREWVNSLIRRIKRETNLAVTLSLGERTDEEFRAWFDAGADRYLLRFETSNRTLYNRIHPPLPGKPSDRIALLRRLRQIGYETGSGVMIGIPGQTYDDLANDILMFGELDLDMIGVGPYIPHHATPLGNPGLATHFAAAEQVPNSEVMTYKVIALSRLACPWANIPSTTALATINTDSGRELGLSRGANIVMPNVTPRKYRALYEIYPSKACIDETAAECRSCMSRRIFSIGRTIGAGRGDSPNRSKTTETE